MTDSLQCCDLHWLSGKHKSARLPRNEVRKSECLQGDGKAEAEQPLRGEHGYRGPPSTSPHPHLALQELSQLSVGFCCTPSWSQHRSHPHTAALTQEGICASANRPTGFTNRPTQGMLALGSHTHRSAEEYHPCSISHG